MYSFVSEMYLYYSIFCGLMYIGEIARPYEYQLFQHYTGNQILFNSTSNQANPP